ncbi:MAG: 30S ribosomal protein S17 [Burkholderiaceae bacterium]|jgi:small subunit ribosomal protein S17|nr:30S ribosomal protein S17 [Burkholderiaceae bacterium]
MTTSEATAGTTAPASATGTKRTLFGRVVSNKMQKTVTVLVERRVMHPVYRKYIVRSTRFHAHAETPYNEGDLVEIQEGRPMSRTKSWTVTRLVRSAPGV